MLILNFSLRVCFHSFLYPARVDLTKLWQKGLFFSGTPSMMKPLHSEGDENITRVKEKAKPQQPEEKDLHYF
jgi:hypothetical protein